MDQLKDILKQMIKHRFWIAVGISALLPVIAYAVGSGPIKDKAKTKTDAIRSANDGVKKYAGGTVPNAEYKPAVDARTAELVKDVNASWKKLYERQATLLTWPKTVEERFRTWERKWPENVDPGAVQIAIIEYVTAYPKFVSEVYQTFKPFDVVEGTGLVSAPAEEILLRPFPFTESNPPELGRVWAAQERLWTQRTLLEVVAEVNKDAKDWNTATIKQINLLEVGNGAAQDQRSIAKGETLNEAPAIVNPAAPPPPPAEGGGTPGQAPIVQQNPDSVFYIKNDSTQFKILPFQISVLIEQDRVQNLLTALENSPMAIQVMEFEMSKPVNRVVKPVKGQSMNYFEYTGVRPSTPGTAFDTFGGRRYSQPMPGGPGRRDMRSQPTRAERDKMIAEAVKKAAGVTIHDPYFNIVEVTVYGQTRFYNPPPPEPAPPPSAAPEPPPATAPGATPPGAEPPKTEGETPKTETPKTEGEAPKTETPKTETPKTETPKADGEVPKTEAPKEAAAPKNSEPPKAEPGPAPAPGPAPK
jgi:hypothetical protein